jgi:hypothetical protein
MPQSLTRNFTSVQADPASSSGAFVQGLLDPAAPVPKAVHGQTPKRFAVYRNNVTVSLVRAMESNFPIVRRLLGEQYFAGLAREFVQKHPPRSPLMFHYGDTFSDFLKAEEDLGDYPYLGDVAKLEQQVRLSYHEADAPTVSPTILTQVSEEHLMAATFEPHPAMAVVESDFPIHAIYNAHQGKDLTPVENITTPESVLVVRPLHNVTLHPLNRTQAVFLKALAAGQSLGDSADAAFAQSDDFDLSGAIGLLLLPGTFQSMHTKKV